MLIEHWDLVAADLISEYACNVYDRAQVRAVSWPAGRVMIGGLFAVETRISRWYDHEYGTQQVAPTLGRGRG
jgi:hypothetical protein